MQRSWKTIAYNIRIMILLFIISIANFDADALDNPGPKKSDLLSQRWRNQDILLLYGASDRLSSERFKTYAVSQQERMRRRNLVVKSADAVSKDEIIAQPTYMFGTPVNNVWLTRLENKLPINFTDDSFDFHDKNYADSTHVIILLYPNPLAPDMPLYITAGNSATYLQSFIESRYFGDLRGDYQVFQDGRCIAFGLFDDDAPEGWIVDPASHRDYLEKTEVVARESDLTIISHGAELTTAEKAAFVDQRSTFLRALKTTAGIAITPYRIHLYGSFEDKGIITDNTDLAHNEVMRRSMGSMFSSSRINPERVIEKNSNNIHMVFRHDIAGDGGLCEIQYQLRQALGKPALPALEVGLSAFFTSRWRGMGYEYWASKIVDADKHPDLWDLLYPESPEAQSYLVTTPLAGTLAAFLIKTRGFEEFKNRYLDWAPNRDEVLRVESEWHDYLADLKAEYTEQIMSVRSRSRMDHSFQKGFCYAHQGYQIYNGYLSKKGDESIKRMADLGVNAVSITPFTSMRDPKKPVPLRLWHNAGGENDESVIHATMTARSAGMRVMLKPHIWVSRSWPGEIEMQTTEDWDTFFRYYYQWLQHYAILAEMYNIELLCAGVEMGLATVGHEDRWRSMMKKIRKIYSGSIVYAPNWGWEFEQVTFWDAFDYIGVNSYYPLSESESATDDMLMEGAKQISDKMEHIAKRYGKDIIITEIGYKSSRGTWIKPYDYRESRILDLEHQKRAYEAMLAALTGRTWLKGIYWWKWSTQLEHGGPENDDFTPNGKPAEQVVAKWYKEKF